MTSYLTRLRRELADLKAERTAAEMRDDFAYTNGTIRSIDAAILRIRHLIEEEEGRAVAA